MSKEIYFTLASSLKTIPFREWQTVTRCRANHIKARATFKFTVRIDGHQFGHTEFLVVIKLHKRLIPSGVVEEQVQIAVFACGHSIIWNR